MDWMRLAKDLIFFWGLCLFVYGVMGAFLMISKRK